jgi:predicted transcriptional regulator
MRRIKAQLGELESQIMQILWSGGAFTAEAVRERLDRGLKEATVRTVLRRLQAGAAGQRDAGTMASRRQGSSMMAGRSRRRRSRK